MSVSDSNPKLFLVLGDPVHHSLSPRMLNAAFRAQKIEAVYAALRLDRERVGPVMRELARSGGGGNVTLPHKQTAAAALDRASDAVGATGACNVFWWAEGEGMCGDNTDVAAFTAAAQALLGSALSDRCVLMLGAGGAARAVAYACLRAGVRRLEILNRTVARAESLVRDLGEPSQLSIVDEPRRASSGDGYDLVVNATSLGLRTDDPLPLDLPSVNSRAVMDLVYGPNETAWVRAARAAGLAAEDGRRMLVEQAAASYRLWLDREPPLEVMFEAVGRG